MKKILTTSLVCLLTNILLSQVAGNINYRKRVSYPDRNIQINPPSSNDLLLKIKGLANVKADSYVAIFSVTQVGKTPLEVNALMDERLDSVMKSFKSDTSINIYSDMISFVPVYEFEAERKIFSKKTYNEIPKGFELKKNIHIKYNDPTLLNHIIAKLANQEIYDLVKVDYFSDHLSEVKKALMAEAKEILDARLSNYESVLDVSFETYEKQMTDGFRIVLPTEMYRSYQAYSNSSLNLKRPANVKKSKKGTTLYYQPVVNKEFDFVINPVVVEPVIQVMYEVNVKIKPKKTPSEKVIVKKDYVFLTPNGDLKPLNIH